jgi:glucose-1-phosphate cytidylyltransferase
VLDTGLNTMTGGRIKRAEKYLKDAPFMLTYGDGLSDIDINKLLQFHYAHGKALTMTAVQPDGRFGAMDLGDDDKVNHFMEKPKGDGSWINGGFFVCNPDIFKYIDKEDATIWERSPLESLTIAGELYAFKHYGFWKPMDMLRDKVQLEELWNINKAPWQIWK